MNRAKVGVAVAAVATVICLEALHLGKPDPSAPSDPRIDAALNRFGDSLEQTLENPRKPGPRPSESGALAERLFGDVRDSYPQSGLRVRGAHVQIARNRVRRAGDGYTVDCTVNTVVMEQDGRSVPETESSWSDAYILTLTPHAGGYRVTDYALKPVPSGPDN